tara:strand:- start:8237 stop:8974 length:738 start_codon:yes stop_codon:yes gene_type:complete
MKKSIELSISKPCREDFKNFKTTKSGGFCPSCQKEVIDFSKMSDREISTFFNAPNENTCGRFRPDQLKAYSIPNIQEPKSNAWLRTAFGISLVGLLGTHPLKAQSNEQSRATPTINLEKKAFVEESEQSVEVPLNDTLTKGQVLDAETGEAMPFANVFLRSKGIGTSTDFDGKFTFPIKLEEGDTLIIQFIGYANKIIKLDKQMIESRTLSVRMRESEIVFMGEVQVNTPYRSKTSFWQRLKAKF